MCVFCDCVGKSEYWIYLSMFIFVVVCMYVRFMYIGDLCVFIIVIVCVYVQ